jgi:hypothetical protein
LSRAEVVDAIACRYHLSPLDVLNSDAQLLRFFLLIIEGSHGL